MTAYLRAHPPARAQFRTPRRSFPTGCIVLHTFEAPAGRSAASGARFIQERTTPGSYHRLGDVHGGEVRLVDYADEAYHDSTGSNRWSIGISLMMHADEWGTLSRDSHDALVGVAVNMAAHAARWLHTTHGIVVPAQRVTKPQSDAGRPGFIGHGDRDPGRRSDPGPEFPWEEFLEQFARATTRKGPPMPETPSPHETDVRTIQQALVALGYRLAIDGDFGPITAGHTANALPALAQERDDLKATVARLETGGEMDAEIETKAADLDRIVAVLRRHLS